MKLFVCIAASALSLGAADLRLGIVGTDTSHTVAFASVLNDPANKDYIPGARIVAAYKGGSPDVQSSRDRVEGFAEELKTKYGVEIVSDIPTLLTKVDAVLLESVDGRPHLAQFTEIAKSGKPVFIDKPLSSSLDDARAIARLAREKGIKWFSSSSLRFADSLPALRLEGMNGAMVWGPGPIEEHQQLELSWYGIHAVEVLYSLMGTGCEEVSRVSTDNSEVVTGRWKGGRLGTVRLNRPYSAFGATVFSPKGIKSTPGPLSVSYRALLVEIIKFFQTGKTPVDEKETLELFAFMDAAQRSTAVGGASVKLR